jgi:selenocysteine-specific elongation factor
MPLGLTARTLTLGTAGHIDHGKTSLVEALTGTDTDRLPEEKRRGISVVLGYAQLELGDGTALSVIDVPGHERFVRTMVAGATGIDLFLLVVDAGEGPRPQTHEHLEILHLLGVEQGVVAVTKADAVDEERIAATAEAMAELLPGHETVVVSAVDGRGLPELIQALARAAAEAGDRRHEGATRLYVDRAFSLVGVGPVVTGTLWSGAVEAGDTLELLPGRSEVRVRSVEVHGRTVERATSGQRVAAALSVERRRPPAPGDALVSPGCFVTTYRLDVRLEQDDRIAGPSLTVCHGTSAIAARIVRSGSRYAQLRLSRPLVVARGDRVVLRQEATVGGGVVLDPNPPRQLDARRLELLDRGDVHSALSALVEEPVEYERVRLRLGLPEVERAGELDGFGRIGRWICSTRWFEATGRSVEEALHARDGELDPGLPAAALLGSAPWVDAVVDRLGLESRNGRLYLPGRGPVTGGPGADLEERVVAAGLEPVAVGDGELALRLEREGRIVRLGNGLAIGPAAYAAYRALLLEEHEQAGTVSLAGFRNRAGVSRRVAQLVLERFDADRLTLRVGDGRRLRRSALAG